MNAVPFLRPAEAGEVVPEPVAWTGRRPAAALAATVAHVVPASRLQVRPAPAMVSTGVAAVDALSGGLPRGALTEVCGPTSSGRTSLLVSTLAAMTAQGEVCALVDACDSFAPQTAQAADVDLSRLLWVRCTDVARFTFPVSPGPEQRATRNAQRATWARLEQALKATDLLLQSGGFGMVVVDLGDLPAPAARRVPLTSWFRFRRTVENTATILLVLGRESCAQTCASLVLQLSPNRRSPVAGQNVFCGGTRPGHAELLTGIAVRAELLRSRLERKPVRSAAVQFETRAQWA